MDRVAQRAQRGFVEGLAQRRVDVDRAGDVFQHRAHLQRQRKFARQFGDMRADRLDAEHAVIVLARDHAHEAAIVARVHGERAAVGGEGEHRGDDVVVRRGFVCGSSPALTISGSVKQTAGIDAGIEVGAYGPR